LRRVVTAIFSALPRRPPPRPPPFPYTTLFRSAGDLYYHLSVVDQQPVAHGDLGGQLGVGAGDPLPSADHVLAGDHHPVAGAPPQDRKSTRLNSSHVKISYAVFCLKKKKSKNEC